jgi:hypothetical protein
MTFIRKHLNTSQFLSPTIQTNAIQKLGEYMEAYFSREPNPDAKPTCVNCFDMSGSGKTTTIMEAAKNSNSFRVPISLIDNLLFRPLLDSCKNMGETQDPPLDPEDYISYEKVERYFEKRFQTVLTQLFQCIIEKFNALESSNWNTGSNLIHVTLPDYISPTKPGFPDLYKSLSVTLKELVQTIQKLNRLLVIHLDDCQEFFCGLTKNVEQRDDGKVKVGEIMGLALRLFSRQVCALGKYKEILWVFSGTRPNLYLEMKIASKFGEPYDVSKHLKDFNIDNVATVLGNYFDLENCPDTLKEKMQNLTGPPKLLYWFLLSTGNFKFESMAELEDKWNKVEQGAIILYENQIESTIKSFRMSPDLHVYARNLCLLYTHSFINNEEGFLEFRSLPSSWLPFIEAGLIRVLKNGEWKLYPPNRFLVKIFNNYIKWFNWDTVVDLVANIRSSSSSTNLKGKVFEFLFALEIQSPSVSALWRELGSMMKIKPKLDWNPAIQLIGQVTSHLDQNVIYVMIDPARDKSKTDVVFFAETIESSTPVRILCQLTTQMKNSTDKAKISFSAMFKLADDSIPDYRLFLSPRSSVDLPMIHEQQFADADCFWLDATTFGSILHFSLDLCDPLKTKEALTELMNFAVSLDENELADNIGMFIPGTSKKRKREFQSMNDFYDALKEISDWEEEDTLTVKEIFKVQRIKLSQLSTLTDAKLKEDGLTQRGLREGVLSVIENH